MIYASEVGWTNTSELPLIDALRSYENVIFTTLDIHNNIEKYLQGSPLSDWIKNRRIFQSKFIQTHMNDLLRAAT